MGLLNRRAGPGPREKVEKGNTILKRLGVQARPAATFAGGASRFRGEIWVSKDGEEINGKSVMGLMMLAAGQGSKLRVRAEGPDAAEAVREIEALVASRFNED